MSQQPTVDMIQSVQIAFDFFNERLFANSLGVPIFTFDYRKRSVYGFFQPHIWEREGDTSPGSQSRHELSLNPLHFHGRSCLDILSTLVHEMCHLQQQQLGTPPKNAYHNKAWGSLMRAVGLYPSSTGEPGGKRTGIRVSHYIVQDGPFIGAADELLDSGFDLPYYRLPNPTKDIKKAPVFVCDKCEQKARGKKDLQVTCTHCDTRMLPREDE